MEYIDLFDRNRLPLNQTAIRGSKRPSNLYHQIVHVLIFNNQKELLIQKRQANKKLWPNLWDVSTSGVPHAGESSHQGAERETKEELGLTIDLSTTRPALTAHIDLGFSDYYIIEKNIQLKNLTISPREIQEVRFAKLEEIQELIDHNHFVPYLKEFIPLLWELYQNQGEIQKTHKR